MELISGEEEAYFTKIKIFIQTGMSNLRDEV